MGVAGAVVIAFGSTTASAEEGDRRQLGDGYALVVQNWGVHVVKGKQRAKMAPGFAILDAKVDQKAKKVDVEIDANDCAGSSKYTWTFGHLDARMENTSAFALHKKKDYAGSAAGFAKAVAADPGWNIAAYNLASAQQLLGDKAAATKTLAPWLASAPVETYLHVAFDPELAPLIDQPELTGLRSPKPGNAALDSTGDLTGAVAYAKDRGLIAVTRLEQSWGACGHTVQLELRDAKTGAVVAHEPTVAWSETEEDCNETFTKGISTRARPVVAERAKRLSKVLVDLGFVTAKLTDRGKAGPRSETTGAETFLFPKAKLGLAANNGIARLLVKDRLLGEAPILEHVRDALLVDDPHVAVIWTLRAGREGCEGTDPTDVSLIPYPKP